MVIWTDGGCGKEAGFLYHRKCMGTGLLCKIGRRFRKVCLRSSVTHRPREIVQSTVKSAFGGLMKKGSAFAEPFQSVEKVQKYLGFFVVL